MDAILRLIRDYSVLLYLILGGVFLFFVGSALFAMRDMSRAIYRLERAAVQSRITGNLIRAVLSALGGGMIFMLASLAPPGDAIVPGTPSLSATSAVPTSPATAVISRIGTFTPTVIFVGTQISTQAQATLGPALTATARARATETPTPRPGATAAPTARATTTPTPAATPTRTSFSPVVTPGGVPVATDCANENARITAPAPNERIKGVYTINGRPWWKRAATTSSSCS